MCLTWSCQSFAVVQLPLLSSLSCCRRPVFAQVSTPSSYTSSSCCESLGIVPRPFYRPVINIASSLCSESLVVVLVLVLSNYSCCPITRVVNGESLCFLHYQNSPDLVLYSFFPCAFQRQKCVVPSSVVPMKQLFDRRSRMTVSPTSGSNSASL